MGAKYYCQNENRKDAVRNNPVLNGIDYLEVTSSDQKTLTITFIHNLPGQSNPVPASPELTAGNIHIEGGVRIKNIKVENVVANDNTLTITVDQAGDFSYYTLYIVNVAPITTPPTGFDTQLSSIEFSYKAACPGEFDCKTGVADEGAVYEEPEIDYLAKDYDSFRRVMLDRLSLIMPGWRERNPADMQVMMVELLAYVGDKLSYYQDAVGTEAYLNTARRRISLRRHARLLDYAVHDGCNARTWIFIEVENGGGADGLSIPSGTKLLTGQPGSETKVSTTNFEKVFNEEKPLVFETKHELTLLSEHNEIHFYTWSDTECCLPAGTTKATLVDDPPLSLKETDIIIFEEVCSPTTGLEADANPLHRHVVRLKKVFKTTDELTSTPVVEIEWHEEDALPFPLCVTELVTTQEGTTELREISVARGNVVLADHGLSLGGQEIIHDSRGSGDLFYPRLQHAGITVAESYSHSNAKKGAANGLLDQDPGQALPVISLNDEGETWNVNRDLLASDRFTPEFVAEMESDGSTYLRFGDGTMGKMPVEGFNPAATYRIGNGPAGNAGRDSITRIVADQDGFLSVRNPLPARGGKQMETPSETREFAPQAFRTQERAVTLEDYAQKAELHEEVQKAKANFHWTGSWHTVFVTVDRKNGLDVDQDFKEEMIRHLEKYRMAGYDVEIRQPRFVPLEIVLNVCAKPGFYRSNIKKSLLRVFSRFDLSGSKRGFFHPDNFTFGQAVYLSKIYREVMALEGVESVEAALFKKWGKKSSKEKEKGLIQPAEMEIIRLDNDPSFPEHGIIDFKMFGGL
jgi:hypothetical protein